MILSRNHSFHFTYHSQFKWKNWSFPQYITCFFLACLRCLLDNRLFKVKKTLSFFSLLYVEMWWENLNDVHSLTWIAHRHLKETKSSSYCSMYCAYIIILIVYQFQVRIRHAYEMLLLYTVHLRKERKKTYSLLILTLHFILEMPY